MTESRQKLVRQAQLHQPPWSLLLAPRMTPQAKGEEASFGAYHTTGRNISFGTCGGVSSQGMPAVAGTVEECRRNGHKSTEPLLLPGKWH